MKKREAQQDERREYAEAPPAAGEVDAPLEASTAPQETSRLLQELRVHQVELEIQNDELRAARDEIEVGLRRYTELFEFAPVGYAVLDPDGAILEVNLELERMLGVSRQRLHGWLFASYVDPAQLLGLREFLRGTLSSGPDQAGASFETTLRRGQAVALPVRLTASVLAGPRPRLLVAVHDITAYKHAEIARQEVAQRDEFLAALSHELRNPLFPVCSSLSLLQRVEAGSPEARSAIATIDRQLRHLVHIVDDLLDVTRIARGKITLRRERIELATLVRQTMEDHRTEFESKGVAIETDFEEQPLWVEADATRLVQALGNLLVNASKFTANGGRVVVQLRCQGSQAILSVADTGVGIAPDMRERLFSPFIQAPQTLDRSSGGLGLGLALVKGLVELHGGAVEVRSEGLGRGSEFTIRLPLAHAPAAQPSSAPTPAPTAARHRVLVIEDNVDAADSMRELIGYEGHEARAAYDGPTGIAMAREFHPEIVLCDIGLPGMDGYEVARAMRSDPGLAGTYLVALSGYARPEDRRRSAEAGFDCHIAKPPSEAELDRVLAR